MKEDSNSQWPKTQTEHVLFRPQRAEYVRQSKASSSCVFCQAINEKPSWQNLNLGFLGSSVVFVNKYPYNTGHLLVLPLNHCSDYSFLTDEEFFNLHKAIRFCVKILRDVYQPEGLNVGLNLGRAAGAGIPDHLHYHLIPRWAGDTNFFPLIAQSKVVIEDVKTTYEKIGPIITKEGRSWSERA